MKDEALKLALEALERSITTCFNQYSHHQVMSQQDHFINQAITAIKAALAQPAQEPVAWALQEEDGKVYDCICNEEHDRHEGRYTVPLYTTPPQPAQERNFCSRCGKRTADLTVIHTCTPPQENT
jgi:hypothetical protein